MTATGTLLVLCFAAPFLFSLRRCSVAGADRIGPESTLRLRRAWSDSGSDSESFLSLRVGVVLRSTGGGMRREEKKRVTAQLAFFGMTGGGDRYN